MIVKAVEPYLYSQVSPILFKVICLGQILLFTLIKKFIKKTKN